MPMSPVSPNSKPPSGMATSFDFYVGRLERRFAPKFLGLSARLFRRGHAAGAVSDPLDIAPADSAAQSSDRS